MDNNAIIDVFSFAIERAEFMEQQRAAGLDPLRAMTLFAGSVHCEREEARAELVRLRAELEQARRWSATLWRVVRAYRGYMAGLVRDTSLYMESDDEAWRRHMSDWSEIRRAEQAKQAGEA